MKTIIILLLAIMLQACTFKIIHVDTINSFNGAELVEEEVELII